MSRPLVQLTKNSVPFSWGEDEQATMDTLKTAVITLPAIRPLDYSSSNEVLLAVDSSHIAVGYILSQVDSDSKCRPAQFGSIMWNERESCYSQAKLELYGLFRVLKAVKVWIIGVKNFTVEVDAQYIKGMLNNPDIQPNVSMNRWLAGIQTFDFKLQHVSATKHQGPDRLSRRRKGKTDEENEEGEEEVEEWIDEVLGCGLWVAGGLTDGRSGGRVENCEGVSVFSIRKGERNGTDIKLPTDDNARKCDDDLQLISQYLQTLAFPSHITDKQRTQLIQCARHFFICGNTLW